MIFLKNKNKKTLLVLISIFILILSLSIIKNYTFYRTSLNYYLNYNFSDISTNSQYIEHELNSNPSIKRNELDTIYFKFQNIVEDIRVLHEISNIKKNTKIDLSYIAKLQTNLTLILNQKDVPNTLSPGDIELLNQLYNFCSTLTKIINDYQQKYDNITFNNRWIYILEEIDKSI